MLKNKKLLIVAIIFLILTIMPTIVKANPIDNPDLYDPLPYLKQNDVNEIAKFSGPIINTITTIGIITAVVISMILGIKYMVGSLEEKAEYKKSMIPYIIGVVLLFSVSGVLKFINGIAVEIGKVS